MNRRSKGLSPPPAGILTAQVPDDHLHQVQSGVVDKTDYMQQGKLRGSNKKMSMPMGPFRTHTLPVNVGQLSRFPAGSVVDAAALVEAGLVKNNASRGWPVKVLGNGEIEVALTVRAQAFSASAAAKIEAAGGTAEVVEAAAPAADDSGESSD